ncbi:hypothetical protein Dsin_022557 [Dipteronia sinensis]|uniref:Zinc finger PMZ-type domain-containing protein n=1 Tax=Dipteronia sinensis TaxID=43782 RepID=A0AAE0A2L5_9ROSI|nr:hypothetical protein Dsin_022557 [Dipteronia sinensis]
MDEFQRSDVPKAACLDDIREGFTPIANIDTSPSRHFSFQGTMSNQHIHVHDETGPPFNYNREQVPNRYDKQFAHVQRLVPPPCAFYSINSGEVAPRLVTMPLEVGKLFPSSYALANRFQIRVFKSDTTRYQVRCIVEDCNWRLHAAKVHNSDYFQIRKFDNQHTCSTKAQFLHQRQASARVIEEHIHEKFCDHRLYKPKEIIHDMQKEFGISCNYHKGPVIAIDGTFLKGPYRWVLFVAVCMDGNDQIFPLAFDVGDSETNEAWEWFLTRLHKSVSEVDDLVIFFDRKGSITTGVEKVFPNSFHGACAVHLERNMVEAMNNAVKGCKELPITGVIEYIKGVPHCWFHDRRTAALKLTTQLTTAEDVAISVKDDEARYMRIYPITFYTFLVKDGVLDGTVNLTTKTCTYREFDVDQLLCAHALACIRLQGFSFVDYCSPYYSSVFLVAAYSGEIHLLGQPCEWLVPEDITSKIVQPPVGRHPERPKKNRTPSLGEEITQRSCTTCHRVGHNNYTFTYPKSSRPSSGMESISEIGEASGSHN